MKITLITEDSSVKLPFIKYGGKKIGKGINLAECEPLLSVLKEKNLKIPCDDYENENIYRKHLNSFVRPAKFMFAGRFSEVRDFYGYLNEKFHTNLFIISRRYGLLNAEENIIPYDSHLDDYYSIKDLDKRTDFYNQLDKIVNDSDYVLLFLNKLLISYLINNNFLKDTNRITKLIFVTSKDFKKIIIDSNNIFFHRRGVARIGKEKRKRILEILEG